MLIMDSATQPFPLTFDQTDFEDVVHTKNKPGYCIPSYWTVGLADLKIPEFKYNLFSSHQAEEMLF